MDLGANSDRVCKGAEYTADVDVTRMVIVLPLESSHAFHVLAGTVTTRLFAAGLLGSQGDRPASRHAWELV